MKETFLINGSNKILLVIFEYMCHFVSGVDFAEKVFYGFFAGSFFCGSWRKNAKIRTRKNLVLHSRTENLGKCRRTSKDKPKRQRFLIGQKSNK